MKRYAVLIEWVEGPQGDYTYAPSIETAYEAFDTIEEACDYIVRNPDYPEDWIVAVIDTQCSSINWKGHAAYQVAKAREDKRLEHNKAAMLAQKEADEAKRKKELEEHDIALYKILHKKYG